MVDTLVLGTSAVRLGGSSPLIRTIENTSTLVGVFLLLRRVEGAELTSERSEREVVE